MDTAAAAASTRKQDSIDRILLARLVKMDAEQRLKRQQELLAILKRLTASITMTKNR
jgi:hypothetical protein